jgi:hypothetical protein
MTERGEERQARDLELVKRHLIKNPLKKEETAYRIYLEEHVRKAIENKENEDEAKKDAATKWKKLIAEEKHEYYIKNKDHEEFYENLKKPKSLVNSYDLLVRDELAKARENGEYMCIKTVSEILKKLIQSVKDQYSKCAEEIIKERAEHRDLYEISFGFKTRKPLGACYSL